MEYQKNSEVIYQNLRTQMKVSDIFNQKFKDCNDRNHKSVKKTSKTDVLGIKITQLPKIQKNNGCLQRNNQIFDQIEPWKIQQVKYPISNRPIKLNTDKYDITYDQIRNQYSKESYKIGYCTDLYKSIEIKKNNPIKQLYKSQSFGNILNIDLKLT